MNKAIYKFHVDCGRMGNLEGVFVADKSEIENMIGKEVYFGEISGKHSEVYFDIQEKHLTLVTDDDKMISLFEEFDLSAGHNPLDYYEEQESDEEE